METQIFQRFVKRIRYKRFCPLHNVLQLIQENVRRFVVPACPRCGEGVLKPWVVFFGDSVPLRRVERVRALVESSRALLVVGSSMQVGSTGSRNISLKKIVIVLKKMSVILTRILPM